VSSPPDPDDQEKSTVAQLPGLAAFATMGSTIAACVGLGAGAGLWFDHVTGFAPGGLLIGIVLGTVAAVLSVLRQVRRYL
jgi:F0F1-type ATP synthase assembly protein I